MSIDPAILHAWLAGRSIAREIALPIANHGGFRIDTNTDAEVCRWVFPALCPGLEELGRSIRAPRLLLKLCDSTDVLRSVLPDHWRIEPGNHFMQSDGRRLAPPSIDGYTIDVRRADANVQVRIWSETGVLAASGYGGDTPDAFVYDRIVTGPGHRRKGLGRAVMAALQAEGRHAGVPELLVATDEGRALYESLGWRTISPYASASVASDDDQCRAMTG